MEGINQLQCKVTCTPSLEEVGGKNQASGLGKWLPMVRRITHNFKLLWVRKLQPSGRGIARLASALGVDANDFAWVHHVNFPNPNVESQPAAAADSWSSSP